MNLHNKNKILKLGARKKIYEFITLQSGCHFRDLQRKIGLPASTLKYHLNYLNKNKLIVEQKEGINIHYFSQEFKSDNKTLLSLLRKDSIRKIIILLINNEECTHKEIADFVQLSPSTVSWHLRKLLQKKIITFVRKEGRKHYLLLADKSEITNLLIVYKESFLDALVNKAIQMWDINPREKSTTFM